MVVTPGFALYERFFPYATCHVISRVHTRLLLEKSAYALRHTLFIMLWHILTILPSLHSVLTVDTTDLHYLTSSSRYILSNTTSSIRLPSSSTSYCQQTSYHITFTSRITSLGGFPSRTTQVNNLMSSSSFSELPSRTTLYIILPTSWGWLGWLKWQPLPF